VSLNFIAEADYVFVHCALATSKEDAHE
jgi:hypothetical protein